jgi:copper chaperone CopZ
MTATIDVEGMSCDGCEESVEDALMDVPGVTEASADREHGVAKVEGDADAQALVDAVEDAGYQASV